MSMIPANLSAMHAVTGTTVASVKRLPRAIGWLSAAVASTGLWILAIEAIRLAV